ncbi:hypothetical protein FQK07_01635 [Synechococcus sp. BSF8S]|uniref:hypothetical protein n=1 Tax=Synechococcales TaxID=1890424 RepID=UPI00162ACA25|nr:MULTISPECIES: hypothetical protein [unclassified Synechococcus]MBC1259983.1 hypothetical protein [Synechococcus sp. BSF8S]MBC1262595.1 hypothetical protein [Synechococcus sp. BSA11S]
MRFFTNLRPQTAEIYADSGYVSSAWLLSSHRTTPQTLELAADVRQDGADLMADNGTKPLIDLVIDEFAETAGSILSTYRSIRKESGEPSMSSMPKAVRLPAKMFALEVARFIDTLHQGRDWAAVIDEQMAMDPTHLIAPEDFCIGCLMGLGIDRTMTGWSIDKFRQRNRISLNGWMAMISDPRARDRHVYVTLAAADYFTAKAAGRMAAEEGASNVAVGFAGLNNLQTGTQWTSLAARRKLSQPTATRYVKLAEILFGIRDGFRDAGVRLQRFHGLGLGSRAQYCALPAILDPHTEISVDATSPLHDAVRGRVLYQAPAQGRSRRVDWIAQQVVEGENNPIDGFFPRRARDRHGHDPAGARRWWLGARRPEIGLADLLPDQPLAGSLGWLASGPGSSTTAVTSDWIGHNHAVCDELAGLVPAEQRSSWARDQIQRLISTQGFTLRRAAQTWLELLTFHSPSLSGHDPPQQDN